MGAQSLVLTHAHVPSTNSFAVTAAAAAVQQPLPEILSMDQFDHPQCCRRRHHASSRKPKVVFVMGATGTGKSRLSIDLAAKFGGEIVNSDKIQVYKGLDVVTNKVTAEEQGGIPHHLLGTVEPDEDFTASDFRRCAADAVESILARKRVPIIAGGSNSYIEALVDGDGRRFRSKYDCCFLWVDVSLPVLDSFVSDRVDKMVELGMVEEVRAMFDPAEGANDYAKGIRRAIGVPEMDSCLRGGGALEVAVEEVKENTRKLARRQLEKINRLRGLPGWRMHRVDATGVFRKLAAGEETGAVWEELVAEPCVGIVSEFLNRDGGGDSDGGESAGNHVSIRKAAAGCLVGGGGAMSAATVAVARATC